MLNIYYILDGAFTLVELKRFCMPSYLCPQIYRDWGDISRRGNVYYQIGLAEWLTVTNLNSEILTLPENGWTQLIKFE